MKELETGMLEASQKRLQVSVYFESRMHAELIATFCDEDMYMLMLPALLKYAKKKGGIITESIDV